MYLLIVRNSLINIPTTVTSINGYAFYECPVLQVIDFLHQNEVHPHAFDTCPLLRTTLEEHGTDYMKGRVDALPIHQSCYKLNNNANHDNYNIINYFHSLQDNDPSLSPHHLYLLK